MVPGKLAMKLMACPEPYLQACAGKGRDGASELIVVNADSDEGLNTSQPIQISGERVGRKVEILHTRI